jgi:hypothetical protein
MRSKRLSRRIDRAVADRPANTMFRRTAGAYRLSSWPYLEFLANRREQGRGVSLIDAGRILAVPYNEFQRDRWIPK